MNIAFMKRDGLSKISGIKVLLSVISMLSVVAVAWREWSHRIILDEKESAYAQLMQSKSMTLTELEETQALLETATSELTELTIANRSLGDRITNLEAQREHLRKESDLQVRRAKSLEETIRSLETRVSDAKQRILDLESLPGRLSSELNVARSRLDELESRLDEQGEVLAEVPMAYTFDGISADRAVFALDGMQQLEQELPCPVYLCNANGLILDGWIHRADGGQLIGHAMNWHQHASALVKGEKVFMLPKKNHEKDH